MAKKKKQYGIYDTLDKVWLGKSDGPYLDPSRDKMLLIAIGVVGALEMKVDDPDRFQIREFKEKNLRMRDEVAWHRSPWEVLMRCERGTALPMVKAPWITNPK